MDEYTTIVHEVYKPTYNWGAHIVGGMFTTPKLGWFITLSQFDLRDNLQEKSGKHWCVALIKMSCKRQEQSAGTSHFGARGKSKETQGSKGTGALTAHCEGDTMKQDETLVFLRLFLSIIGSET